MIVSIDSSPFYRCQARFSYFCANALQWWRWKRSLIRIRNRIMTCFLKMFRNEIGLKTRRPQTKGGEPPVVQWFQWLDGRQQTSDVIIYQTVSPKAARNTLEMLLILHDNREKPTAYHWHKSRSHVVRLESLEIVLRIIIAKEMNLTR